MTFLNFFLAVLVVLSISPAKAARIVFDASCIPMAGEADWVIDAPTPRPSFFGQSNPERFPSPEQCTIGADTLETDWHGAYSAWGIDLVISGHWVETIPRGGVITFGDCSNSQDLSFYDVLILPEPQIPYWDYEITAILEFVANGGGLFLIANHCGSDRSNNGYDSARIFEEMGVKEQFGFEFERDPDNEIHPYCDWNESNSNNFIEDLTDPIIYGPHGEVTAIGFYSATAIILHPEFNSTVKAHAWRNGQPQGLTNVTVATCEYGAGRVAAIGDSAPADDGTGDPRDSLFNGWTRGSTTNNLLFLNMSEWLTGYDAVPLPTRTPCPNSTPFPFCDGTATPQPPTITPTPSPRPQEDPVISIYSNRVIYTANDLFELKLDIENNGSARKVNLFLILQIEDVFLFYPTWSEDVRYQVRYLNEYSFTSETIFSFLWPETEPLDLIVFWAGLVDPESNQLVGNYSFTSFSTY